MPTISKGRTPLTLINIFTVAPEKQDELIQLLTNVTEQHVRRHKGFISASLHRGVDGKR
jgi:heme-degrading monooxygenase HmoA